MPTNRQTVFSPYIATISHKEVRGELRLVLSIYEMDEFGDPETVVDTYEYGDTAEEFFTALDRGASFANPFVTPIYPGTNLVDFSLGYSEDDPFED